MNSAEQTLATATGSVMGTLPYLSPEQVKPTGLGVDRRSDVYGLGAVMYELLVGRPPFDPKRLTNMVEAQLIICTENAPRPGDLLDRLEARTIADLAKARGVGPRELRRLLRGRLWRIASRALRKVPGQRHQSAAILAQEVARALEGMPTATKRAKTTKRPNWAMAAVLALLIAVAAITWPRSGDRPSGAASSGLASTYDAVADFDPTPAMAAGPWEYGALPSHAFDESHPIDASTFVKLTHAPDPRPTVEPLEVWTGDEQLHPSVARNISEQRKDVQHDGDNLTFRFGEIVLHPAPTHACVVRWVAPGDGRAKLMPGAAFRIANKRAVVQVVVLINGVTKFKRVLGGSLGAAECATPEFSEDVKKGDTIDFVVDKAVDKVEEFGNNSTGLRAQISFSRVLIP
jgi:hypothetical protein